MYVDNKIAFEIKKELDTIFFNKEDNIFNLLPTAEIKKINHTKLRIWCACSAFYSIPTIELVAFLKTEIIGKAIELGSGNNDLAYHLGILGTDSSAQTHGIGLFNAIFYKNKPTIPKRYTPILEAEEAVNKLKPDTVIASFLTQKYKEGDEETKTNSCLYGANEEAFISKVKKYIHIGNENVHGDKRILKIKHRKIKNPDFLITRCANQDLNVIYIWENN